VSNANVAIDVARMLVLHPDELTRTDTADHAIAAFAQSRVKEVVLPGRRGPAGEPHRRPRVKLVRLADFRRPAGPSCAEHGAEPC
jgi:ferredoxin--NADP+ reductase